MNPLTWVAEGEEGNLAAQVSIIVLVMPVTHPRIGKDKGVQMELETEGWRMADLVLSQIIISSRKLWMWMSLGG